jgi:hypothetical protein
MGSAKNRQRAVCQEHITDFSPPSPGSHIGIAPQTLGLAPLNGLRIPELGSACGWYVWGGELTSEAPDFYQPLCVEHLAERCPLAIEYLGLPPAGGS